MVGPMMLLPEAVPYAAKFDDWLRDFEVKAKRKDLRTATRKAFVSA